MQTAFASRSDRRRLLDSFIAATRHGHVDALEGLLASEFVAISTPGSRGMTSQPGSASGQWLAEAPLQIRRFHSRGWEEGKDHRQAPEATVRSLISRDLAGDPARELSMITVEYRPGSVDPVHTHHAQSLVYVLDGTIEMQVRVSRSDH